MYGMIFGLKKCKIENSKVKTVINQYLVFMSVFGPLEIQENHNKSRKVEKRWCQSWNFIWSHKT